MIWLLLAQALVASPILHGLDVGQSIEFAARIDCQITNDKWDLNGAGHSSRMASASSITFVFPAEPVGASGNKTADFFPIVELDTLANGSSYLSNVEATAVPHLSSMPQPPILLKEGDARMMTLLSRGGAKNEVWDFESTQIGVHADTIKETGICKLRSEADPA